MNVISSVRRTDQPLQIGSRHGYRIDGDLAYINAELSVPPYHPGGSWALELWAGEYGYQGGELSGVKVAEIQFDVPTPIAPHTHRVEAQAPVRLPLQGMAHAMMLALVERGDERRVHDVVNYPELETFPAPHFDGDLGYEIRGHEIVLQAACIVNPRAAGNLSGTLALELWASPLDSEETPETGRGYCLAAAQLDPIAGAESAFGLACRAAFNEPAPGQYRLELLLREWTQALGYLTRDRRAFSLHYEVLVPEVVVTPPAVALETSAPKAEPVAVAAVVAPKAEPVAVAAVVAPKAEPVAAAAVVTPKAEPVAVAAVVAPKAEPVAVAAVVTPKVEPVAAAAVVTPKAEPVAVAPVVAPKAEPVAVAAVVAPKAEPAVVAASPVVAPVAAPAAANGAPVTPIRAPRVSIQTATVEELSRLKGLNLQIAKEIVKARPFAALEDLLKVRGVGRKTFDALRSLITL